MQKRANVVGAGIAGAAAAWRLGQNGFAVRVFEKTDVVAGHIRTEWLNGIPYEPHGAHIFHTSDEAIWGIVASLSPMVPYRHRVVINIDGLMVDWPIRRSEVHLLPGGDEIQSQIDRRPRTPDPSNFESYCISLLGQKLYEMCVQNYTRKQWGRDPETLSADIARNRIELRSSNTRDYFSDPYQGWPLHGYGSIVEAMLKSADLHLGVPVSVSSLPELVPPGEPVVVTAALDDFFEHEVGLEWRGVRLESRYLPSITLQQPAMVVNEPASEVPWTRTIETKWALDDLHAKQGTIIMTEYPGASSKHYPVLDSHGLNRKHQRVLMDKANCYSRNPIRLAGRLATYTYINMDEAIRQGFEAADQIIALA